jgi:uncharacterized protein Smg (DUF494 family)
MSKIIKVAHRLHNTLITSGLDFDDRMRALKLVKQLQERQRNEMASLASWRQPTSVRAWQRQERDDDG